MKSTQNVKPELLSAAQPPKIAGHLFQIRSSRESITETSVSSLTQAMRSNHNLGEPDSHNERETPSLKKQCAGLW